MLRITEEILASVEWRDRELENMKKIGVLALSRSGEFLQKEYYRMCVPYIYAHWEGFVVETFGYLMAYLNSLEIKRYRFISEIQTFSLLKEFRPLSGKQSFSDCQDFNDKFVLLQDQNLFINIEQFSTKSNLNYKQFKTILLWFGIQNNFAKYEYSINKLVNIRNRIAHGENGINIEYSQIESFISVLLELFDEIVLEIDNYIENRKYLNIAERT